VASAPVVTIVELRTVAAAPLSASMAVITGRDQAVIEGGIHRRHPRHQAGPLRSSPLKPASRVNVPCPPTASSAALMLNPGGAERAVTEHERPQLHQEPATGAALLDDGRARKVGVRAFG